MKDNFSKQAGNYAKYRPTYPEELFEFIISHVKTRNIAWDCGTGNGQTAKILSGYFEKVFATDISQQQLDHAYRASNIFYFLQPAEQTDFLENLFDMVTVSQALHWFRLEEFYKEVKRVAKPGAWIAVWTYSNLSISPEIDELINIHHYKKRLGSYWDYERKYVDEYYQTLPFPFKEIKTPTFQIKLQWNLEELRGYLETWSALQKFIVARHFNPVPELIGKITPFWTAERMPVIFPLHLRMGLIEK